MSDPGSDPPLLSIGIPLYAAAPWVDRIADNIRRNAAPSIEFVLSDQHGLDDALVQVQQRLSGIARMRCFASHDALNWIGNYNVLLREARGDYFRILTQDDVLNPECIAAATAAFAADDATVLVVGPADLIDAQGVVIQSDIRRPAAPLSRSTWRARLDALRLFAGGVRYENANLGMIRRRVAVERGLSIPHTAGESGLSVRVWLFALALHGRIQYQPAYRSQRCVHPQSYTARYWRRSIADQLRRALSYMKVGAAAWWSARAPLSIRLLGLPVVCAAACVLPARQGLRRFGSRFRDVRAAQSQPANLGTRY